MWPGHFMKYLKQLFEQFKNKIYSNEAKKIEYNLHAKFLFTCPVCHQNIKEFLPLPNEYWEKFEKFQFIHSLDKFETLHFERYLCPYCFSSDRDRLYALYIDKHLMKKPALNSKARLLDIAPSACLANWLKQKEQFNYRSCDLYMENVDEKIDITDMKEYPDNSFDIIICSHVLEHVNDDKRAAKELYRILAPSGWAIIMVPISLVIENTHEDPCITSEEQRWHHYGQFDHVRLYSKSGFINLLTHVGFKVDSFTIKDFDDYSFFKNGICPKSVLYIAKKT